MSSQSKFHLSMQTVQIIRMIAEGRPYDQIVAAIGCSYLDIFRAADEVLSYSDAPSPFLAEIRDRYPRAYEPWTNDEEMQCDQLAAAGESLEEIRQASRSHS